MKLLTFLSLVIICSSVCTLATPPRAINPTHINLSNGDKNAIGKKIWQNECAGSIDGLTTWNAGEEFPSMGIGHFIWYPKGFDGVWTESFPDFIRYAQARGRRDIPSWLTHTRHCPWPNKAIFQAEFRGEHLSKLRQFLANSVILQTEFIIQKSQLALSKILKAVPLHERQRILTNYQLVSSTPNGVYALIDYVNFKGEGVNPRERYNGHGWGLLQVLQNMRQSHGNQDSARAFAESAKRILDRRINNAPPSRGEQRWRAGWHNRCNTYAQPF